MSKPCYAMDHLGKDFNGGLNPCGYSVMRDGKYVCTRESGYTSNQFPACRMDKPYRKQIDMLAGANAEHCVCCGDVIPEGRQVCPTCSDETEVG